MTLGLQPSTNPAPMRRLAQDRSHRQRPSPRCRIDLTTPPQPIDIVLGTERPPVKRPTGNPPPAVGGRLCAAAGAGGRRDRHVRAGRSGQQGRQRERGQDRQSGSGAHRDEPACRVRQLRRAAERLCPVLRAGQQPRAPGDPACPRNSALFEVISRRYLKSSTIITSHTGVAGWGERRGDPMLAAAVLDRLLHTGIVVSIDGPSYRMRAHQQRSRLGCSQAHS